MKNVYQLRICDFRKIPRHDWDNIFRASTYRQPTFQKLILEYLLMQLTRSVKFRVVRRLTKPWLPSQICSNTHKTVTFMPDEQDFKKNLRFCEDFCFHDQFTVMWWSCDRRFSQSEKCKVLIHKSTTTKWILETHLISPRFL